MPIVLKKENGDATYISIIIFTLIAMLTITVMSSILSVVQTKGKIDNAVDQIVRQIQLSGKVDEDTENMKNYFMQTFNVDHVEFEIDADFITKEGCHPGNVCPERRQYRGHPNGIITKISSYESPEILKADSGTLAMNTRKEKMIYSCKRRSTALCEQIDSISKDRICRYIGRCSDIEIDEINKALLVSLNLTVPRQHVSKLVGIPNQWVMNFSTAIV